MSREQQRLISELQCGAVFLNAMVASDPRLPFGGIKHSSYGRELSAAFMRVFLNAKTVLISTPRSTENPLTQSLSWRIIGTDFYLKLTAYCRDLPGSLSRFASAQSALA
jgi:hypothetical protein